MSFIQFQVRRDTGANWTSVNPILAAGEIGLDLTLGRFKLGDGTTAWTGLAYQGGGGGGASYIFTQASPAATWIINHGLGSFVHVTILNSSGVIVETDVVEGTLNTATATFSTPQSGTAIVSI